MRRIFKDTFVITQPWGTNKKYYKKVSKGKLKNGHEGWDLVPGGNDNTVIWPDEAKGIVVRDVDTPRDGYGNYVTIWIREKNIALQFCHLKENFLSVNDTVKAGDEIGIMGNTGNSEGAHVHFNLIPVDSRGYRTLRGVNSSFGHIDPGYYLLQEVELANK